VSGILGTIETVVVIGGCAAFGYRSHVRQQQAIARDRAAYTDVDYHRIADELFDHVVRLSQAVRPGVPVELSEFVKVQAWGRSPASQYHIERVTTLLANNTYVSRVPAPPPIEGEIAASGGGFWFVLKDGWRSQAAESRSGHSVPPQTNVTYQLFENGARVSQNIGSPGASAHGDHVGIFNGDVTVLSDLVRSLHADAALATSAGEEHEAIALAEELEDAVKAKDEPRAKFTLERLKLFLDVAQAGFILTKAIVPEVLKLFVK
jgi:hypothetical protein